jgi:hypothetical protein
MKRKRVKKKGFASDQSESVDFASALIFKKSLYFV